MLNGNVFITGGAGYLGRAILRRADRESWPAQFTVYSRDEEKQHQLRRRHPDVRCVLGDVGNLDRLMMAMTGHDLVIHAAAVKFVPEAEFNVGETIDVNVGGSINVAAAAYGRVQGVIGISTDKACSPLNTYGATKMLMERYFSEANSWPAETRYIVCRYGNVVASTGSIVPVFRQQVADRGKVSVTDPDMTRFWLSPDDAVDIIIASALMINTNGGSIVVPRPAAMRIGDVAEVVAGESPVEIVGPRPGEKRHESLISPYEAARTVTRGDYHLILPPTSPPVESGIAELTSDKPDRWVTHDEMRAMIEDAEELQAA